MNCCEEFLALFSDNENVVETTSKQFNNSFGLGKNNKAKHVQVHQKSKPLMRRSGMVIQRNSNIFDNIQNKNNKVFLVLRRKNLWQNLDSSGAIP